LSRTRQNDVETVQSLTNERRPACR
jgi:hypothetical protein